MDAYYTSGISHLVNTTNCYLSNVYIRIITNSSYSMYI